MESEYLVMLQVSLRGGITFGFLFDGFSAKFRSPHPSEWFPPSQGGGLCCGKRREGNWGMILSVSGETERYQGKVASNS